MEIEMIIWGYRLITIAAIAYLYYINYLGHTIPQI